VMPCQAVTEPTALAAGPVTDYTQAGSSDISAPQHVTPDYLHRRFTECVVQCDLC